MRYSSEVRWILPGSVPPEVLNWFDQQGLVTKEPPRTDFYVNLGDTATTSIKLREGSMEFKAMRSPAPVRLEIGSITGLQSQWAKWSCSYFARDLSGTPARQSAWLAVWKSRSIRYFNFDAAGTVSMTNDCDSGLNGQACEVELTSMRILPVDTVLTPPADEQWEQAPQWWTFAFEAYGTRSKIVDYLRQAVHRQLLSPPPVSFKQQMSAAYPAWLASQTRNNGTVFLSAS